MKLLLIKLGAKGDVLRTTGILPALKEKYPGADIYWMVSLEAEEILKGVPYIKEVFKLDKNGFLSLLHKIKNMDFQLVINLDESFYAGYLTATLPVKKIGFIYREGYIYPTLTFFDLWRMGIFGPYPKNDRLKKKNRFTYQELLRRALGLNSRLSKPILNLNQEDENFAEGYLKNQGWKSNVPLIGINFGASQNWNTKRLPLFKVIELREAFKKMNFNVVILGGEEESKEIEILKEKFPTDFFANNLPLRRFAAIIKRCSLLVTADTLALHIDLAVGTKVLALFGPTAVQEVELYGLGEKIVAPVNCVCCYKKYCDRIPFCMEEFDISLLVKKAEKILREK